MRVCASGGEIMKYVILSGKSTMKGRNGYTSLGHVSSLISRSDGQISVDFYSLRPRGGVGTARLDLTREDAIALKAWFADLELEDTRSPREIEIGSIAFAAEAAHGEAAL